ncbi:hypothetical protein FAM21834_01272 [Lentilactobacillus parabuchneri]|jgi:hypothetical protein|uniref:Uncharacterized protein n=2 Tax=Lentilactobacillus parabuchneri TaxID=152331 RepID=A0A1X1FF42_9LACO|nr:hypothetical protein [Lentilactobacillus parabuchneri]APR07403.1 hypothetical protein FAM21731_01212 [Lentilactobacillus parabuchneri]KRM47246.1 hypothetical protein FC51_GL000944 [Lentilactobacillus parabuchneri DSM 5707 = NBRC 107865]KRN79960.1 hypothetical protein IV42_GL000757 [Lentilactobacillus parabuchneri]MBW0223134.1 hypothetical protein [Lentilactobacillus parabuchneri]MBW0245442.1 hypothetical protein [Lentilactobacillus parabuchneri]
MAQDDAAVKTALIVMYVIGVACLAITFFLLDKVNGKWFTKFSVGLATIVLIMGMILLNVVNLN